LFTAPTQPGNCPAASGITGFPAPTSRSLNYAASGPTGKNREKVDLTIDFITSQGDKLALTATAEAQASSGHDVLQMSDWYVATQADNLEAVDELVSSLIKEHG